MAPSLVGLLGMVRKGQRRCSMEIPAVPAEVLEVRLTGSFHVTT